ncbi:hypothetical protein BV898_10676 [Hypsibius exemplaris]|uniref:Uncharacterized protein n=1 Tax=Hypsibius exemplaris TaxID=2072580 RepID=A0A1W0WJ21_HYPEX|nr:hypothetical protein BV898_10676 [Hypsibius exemplaris]
MSFPRARLERCFDRVGSDVPGPGTYDPKGDNATSHGTTFNRSRRARFDQIGNEVPGPGRININPGSETRSSQSSSALRRYRVGGLDDSTFGLERSFMAPPNSILRSKSTISGQQKRPLPGNHGSLASSTSTVNSLDDGEQGANSRQNIKTKCPPVVVAPAANNLGPLFDEAVLEPVADSDAVSGVAGSIIPASARDGSVHLPRLIDSETTLISDFPQPEDNLFSLPIGPLDPEVDNDVSRVFNDSNDSEDLAESCGVVILPCLKVVSKRADELDTERVTENAELPTGETFGGEIPDGRNKGTKSGDDQAAILVVADAEEQSRALNSGSRCSSQTYFSAVDAAKKRPSMVDRISQCSSLSYFSFNTDVETVEEQAHNDVSGQLNGSYVDVTLQHEARPEVCEPVGGNHQSSRFFTENYMYPSDDDDCEADNAITFHADPANDGDEDDENLPELENDYDVHASDRQTVSIDEAGRASDLSGTCFPVPERSFADAATQSPDFSRLSATTQTLDLPDETGTLTFSPIDPVPDRSENVEELSAGVAAEDSSQVSAHDRIISACTSTLASEKTESIPEETDALETGAVDAESWKKVEERSAGVAAEDSSQMSARDRINSACTRTLASEKTESVPEETDALETGTVDAESWKKVEERSAGVAAEDSSQVPESSLIVTQTAQSDETVEEIEVPPAETEEERVARLRELSRAMVVDLTGQMERFVADRRKLAADRFATLMTRFAFLKGKIAWAVPVILKGIAHQSTDYQGKMADLEKTVVEGTGRIYSKIGQMDCALDDIQMQLRGIWGRWKASEKLDAKLADWEKELQLWQQNGRYLTAEVIKKQKEEQDALAEKNDALERLKRVREKAAEEDDRAIYLQQQKRELLAAIDEARKVKAAREAKRDKLRTLMQRYPGALTAPLASPSKGPLKKDAVAMAGPSGTTQKLKAEVQGERSRFIGVVGHHNPYQKIEQTKIYVEECARLTEDNAKMSRKVAGLKTIIQAAKEAKAEILRGAP